MLLVGLLAVVAYLGEQKMFRFVLAWPAPGFTYLWIWMKRSLYSRLYAGGSCFPVGALLFRSRLSRSVSKSPAVDDLWSAGVLASSPAMLSRSEFCSAVGKLTGLRCC